MKQHTKFSEMKTNFAFKRVILSKFSGFERKEEEDRTVRKSRARKSN